MYRDKKTGQFRQCRVKAFTHNEDPMNDYVGSDICVEIANDLRKRDLRDGCTECRLEVEENLSEPDVMSRWELRRM